MADGSRVGSGYIEITPAIDKMAMRQAEKRIQKDLERMTTRARQQFRQQRKDVVGPFGARMDALHKGETKPIFEDYRAEMKAFQQLQKQRAQAHKEQMRALDRERAKKEALWKAEHQAYAMEKARKDALAKANIKGYEMERARKEALWKAEHQAHAIEKARRDAIAKAEHQAYATEAERIRQIQKAEVQAHAEDRRRTEAAHRAMVAAMARAARGRGTLNNISEALSQLSTRIGIASFQLQMLGTISSVAITAPVAVGLGMMTKSGLEFATSIGYARASMEALLGPTEDVEKIIADIAQMAIDSPLFNTEDAISYAQKLASVKIKGDDLYKTMQAMSNIMLTQGVAGPERANLAMMAYTQILSKGAIGMDDLRQQFAEHVPGGIQIFEEVAKRMGYKTIKLLSEAMKDGEVTAAELNAEFIKFGNLPKYVSGANKAAKTLGGVWQAFREEMQTEVGMAFDANRSEIIKAIEGIRPVVMQFIDWFVRSIPGVLMWLNRLVATVREWRVAYNNLSAPQKEAIAQVIAFAIAVGPASVAIGIFGTAISGAANATSLLARVLAMAGAGAGSAVAWATGIGAAIIALVGTMIYLYRTSAPFRIALLQVLNVIKDYVVIRMLLPLVDGLVGAFRSFGRTLSDLGLKVEYLSYVAYLLVVPLMMVGATLAALWVVIKVVQVAVLALASALWLVLRLLSLVLAGYQWLAEVFSRSGAKEWWLGVAEGIGKTRHEIENFVDVEEKWSNLTSTSSNATEDLRKGLAGMDLTVSGLTNGFTIFNRGIDSATQKQLTLADAINNARDAMQSQNSIASGLVQATDTYKQSLNSLRESIAKNKKTLDDKTAAGKANREELRKAALASYELMLQDIASGVPMEQAIRRHRERAKALQDEFGKSKKTREAAQGLIDTYGKVPKDVRTLLQMMGYTDINAKMLDLYAMQRSLKNGTTIPEEKARMRKLNAGVDPYASGGLIRGPGGPTSDVIPILASNKEYMIRASAVRKLGVGALDYINRYGALPISAQYAEGGMVKWPFPIDVKGTQIPELIGGGPNTGGMGVAKMMSILWKQFPGLPLLSGYRPGAVTSTGNRSYHAMNRAVDLPPRLDVFNWISSNYGKGTKELIFTPAWGRQIKNGQPHIYTGGTIQRDHYDHLHWAYDNGGVIPPGQPFINKTGASELALNSAQGAALEEKINNSDRPVYVSVYVDGVRRDAEIVFEQRTDDLIRALGGA